MAERKGGRGWGTELAWSACAFNQGSRAPPGAAQPPHSSPRPSTPTATPSPYAAALLIRTEPTGPLGLVRDSPWTPEGGGPSCATRGLVASALPLGTRLSPRKEANAGLRKGERRRGRHGGSPAAPLGPRDVTGNGQVPRAEPRLARGTRPEESVPQLSAAMIDPCFRILNSGAACYAVRAD